MLVLKKFGVKNFSVKKVLVLNNFSVKNTKKKHKTHTP